MKLVDFLEQQEQQLKAQDATITVFKYDYFTEEMNAYDVDEIRLYHSNLLNHDIESVKMYFDTDGLFVDIEL